MKKMKREKVVNYVKNKNKKLKKSRIIEDEDDFDTNNPDYLAILAEVNENPRD